MGVITGQRRTRTATTQEGVGVVGGVQSANRRRWSNLMLIFVVLVIIAEIALLDRLDMAKNAAMVYSWTNSFYYASTVSTGSSSSEREEAMAAHEEAVPVMGIGNNNGTVNYEVWLESEDAIAYSRDFRSDPIWVSGADWSGGLVLWDVSLGLTLGQIRSLMLHLVYLMMHQHLVSFNPWNPLTTMQRTTLLRHDSGRGYNVVMTTSLSSEVPVGYFSWAEYDIMAPLQPKSESAFAAAFISNSEARNILLQALEGLEKFNVKIDSYGACHGNHDGRVDKVETLKHYKFSLAFENSNEVDYVTEKFFQSLVAGAVPVVIGAPNIQEFAPSPGSVLHIKELNDVASVAKTMKYLAGNPDAYNQSLRWKYEGPSDSFKALVDMAAVHSSCHLCIHLATKIQESEERNQKRRCKCTRGSETVYHIYVRERGRFEMDSIFLRSSNLTLEELESTVLKKFQSLNHVPIRKQERPESTRGPNELKIYRIYPVVMTQREAFYTIRFNGDADLRSYVESNPCAKFDVIFG